MDFVNLSGVQGTNITDQLWEWKGGNYVPNSTYNLDVMDPGAQWATNRGPGVTSVSVPTFGILNQIAVGQGLGTRAENPWVRDEPGCLQLLSGSVPGFGQSAGNLRNVPTTNTFYAPYAPTRTVYFYTSWQVNDPLVHYTISDLTDPSKATLEVDTSTSANPMSTFGTANFSQ